MMYWMGFLFGLAGSLHCIGMCGPLALALPVPSHLNRTLALLLYNAGRVLTYAVIGSGFGMLGKVVVVAGFQQYLSILCGVIVLVMVLFAHQGFKKSSTSIISSLSSKIRNQFGVLVKQQGLRPYLLLGILNGLLPCGLVYMALAGATATGTAWQGAAYMALFGFGTLPAMFGVAYVHRLFSFSWKSKINGLVRGFVVATGLLLILRGMNLGIPYLSPKTVIHGTSCCSAKCH